MTNDPAVGGFVANSRDVTKQIQQQQLNMESLKEKEILLAEIHHRVKNNLAVVSGMMQLQALEEENKEIKDRLFDGISRVKTMANIHEQLYKSNSFSKLEFSDNIRSLVYSIQKTFQARTRVNVHFNCELVQININQAIPCSLIMNEVVTNIFKHAFPDRDTGDIFIDLSKCESSNNVLLSVRDNGIGLPDNFDTMTGGSLGLNLIDVLAQQLDADYTYASNGEGTNFDIRFRKDEIRGIGNGLLQ
jgi:two-component sensor histidine kinase